MSEVQNAAFDAAYKVAYEAALEAAQQATTPTAYPAKQEETVELSFTKVTQALRNHWIMITAVTLVFAVLGFLYTQFLVTPRYQASVNMIVQTNNVSVNDGTVSNDYVNSAKNLAKTYSRILNSSKVQNHVIKELGLDMTSFELNKLAVAAPVTDSQIVRVTVTTEDAELSQRIAEAYLKLGPVDLNELVEAGKCNAVSGVDVKGTPIKPGMKRTVALMAVVGLALSFAIALLREMRNHYISNINDIKRDLNLPLLGVIPLEEV